MGHEIAVISRDGTFGLSGAAKLAVRAFRSLGVTAHAIDPRTYFTWQGQVEACLHYDNPNLDGSVPATPPGIPYFGMWHWELPVAPSAWVQRKVVDEIWGPSPFVVAAFSNPHTPTRVVTHPLVAEDYASIQPLPKTAPFQVVSLFDWRSSRVRKNPEAAIEAFKLAFGHDPGVSLTIKSQWGSGYPTDLAWLRASIQGWPNIQLIDEVWAYPKVQSFIQSADVLISTHRAEGFGLTLAEAMLMGVPVVATGYSGNLAFMDSSNSILLPYQMLPVRDVARDPVAVPYSDYGHLQWADPDVEGAAKALSKLREDREFREHLGRAGQQSVAVTLSPEMWFETLPSVVRGSI